MWFLWWTNGSDFSIRPWLAGNSHGDVCWLGFDNVDETHFHFWSTTLINSLYIINQDINLLYFRKFRNWEKLEFLQESFCYLTSVSYILPYKHWTGESDLSFCGVWAKMLSLYWWKLFWTRVSEKAIPTGLVWLYTHYSDTTTLTFDALIPQKTFTLSRLFALL